jgi:hypothetical protein
VRRTAEEPLFNALLQQHHYLGYTQPVGEHLKYLVFAGADPIAAMAWSSPPATPGPTGPVHRLVGSGAPP